MGAWDFTRNLFNSLPVTGGITSALWGDPDQEKMQQGFQQSREELAKQRAYQMDARMQAMKQMSTAFGPRNQMLGQMMGMKNGQVPYDLSQILQNPMSLQQQTDIRDSAFGGSGKQQPAMPGQGPLNNPLVNPKKGFY